MLNINPQYKSNQNSLRNPSFGTIKTVLLNNGLIKYNNNTTFFRNDLYFDKLVEYLESKKVPPKIYCYACSDGSEPYSIILKLISILGEKAKKYFPIIARDIDTETIHQAKQSEICLFDKDMNAIKYEAGEAFQQLFHLKKRRQYGRNYRNEFSGANAFYRVDESLTQYVDFGIGDIVKDSKTLDFDNSVLFFRNVWPYLSPANFKSLFLTLTKRLQPSSSLVLGHYDYYERPLIIATLPRANFKEVMPYVFEKSKKSTPQTLEVIREFLKEHKTALAHANFDEVMPHICKEQKGITPETLRVIKDNLILGN